MLTDEQVQQFIVNGYLTVRADYPPSFHEGIRQQIDEVFEDEGNPGNNILPRIPDIGRVFEHPAVAGALTSLLGPGYNLNPHRHCHLNRPGSKGRPWPHAGHTLGSTPVTCKTKSHYRTTAPAETAAESRRSSVEPYAEHHTRHEQGLETKSATDRPITQCSVTNPTHCRFQARPATYLRQEKRALVRPIRMNLSEMLRIDEMPSRYR